MGKLRVAPKLEKHSLQSKLVELSDPARTLDGQDDDDDDEKDTPRTDRKRRGSLYIVLEYLEHDLAGLLDLSITWVCKFWNFKVIIRSEFEWAAGLQRP